MFIYIFIYLSIYLSFHVSMCLSEVSKVDLRCNRHCEATPVDPNGPRGLPWPLNSRKPTNSRVLIRFKNVLIRCQ